MPQSHDDQNIASEDDQMLRALLDQFEHEQVPDIIKNLAEKLNSALKDQIKEHKACRSDVAASDFNKKMGS